MTQMKIEDSAGTGAWTPRATVRTQFYRSAPTANRAKLGVPLEAWFAAIVLLCCFTPAARVIQLLFTPVCGLLGFYLIRKSSSRYVIFVLSLWLFSPFVRRVADFHSSFLDPSPILLGPLLASCVALIPLIDRPGQFLTRKFLPLSLAFLGMIYGLLIGLAQLPIQPVITDFLRWSIPLVFAAYCLGLGDDREEVAQAVESASIYGLILVGAYGIWQSFSPAPWDVFWLSNIDASSFGSAQDESLRVFSTMNSPGPFAEGVAGLILLLMGSTRKTARLAQLLGVVALVLSEVRSAWIGIVLGFLYIFFRSGTKARLRMISFCGVCGVALVIGLALSGNTEHLTKRFSTFTNLKQDESFSERLKGSQRALSHALGNPFGGGMGYLDSAFAVSTDAGGSDLGAHDNGFFEFLVTLGFLGCILYGASLLLLLARGLSQRGARATQRTAYFAVCLSFLSQLPTGNPLFGVDGFIFWMAAALMLRCSTAASVDGKTLEANVTVGKGTLMPFMPSGR